MLHKDNRVARSQMLRYRVLWINFVKSSGNTETSHICHLSESNAKPSDLGSQSILLRNLSFKGLLQATYKFPYRFLDRISYEKLLKLIQLFFNAY